MSLCAGFLADAVTAVTLRCCCWLRMKAARAVALSLGEEATSIVLAALASTSLRLGSNSRFRISLASSLSFSGRIVIRFRVSSEIN